MSLRNDISTGTMHVKILISYEVMSDETFTGSSLYMFILWSFCVVLFISLITGELENGVQSVNLVLSRI
jgi:hypothetical protein